MVNVHFIRFADTVLLHTENDNFTTFYFIIHCQCMYVTMQL